jgi:hypothetical protein
MPESDRLTTAEIEAAVRILCEEGCAYNWWPFVTKSYEEFAASDRIGISELSGIVERCCRPRPRRKPVTTRLERDDTAVRHLPYYGNGA